MTGAEGCRPARRCGRPGIGWGLGSLARWAGLPVSVKCAAGWLRWRVADLRQSPGRLAAHSPLFRFPFSRFEDYSLVIFVGTQIHEGGTCCASLLSVDNAREGQLWKEQASLALRVIFGSRHRLVRDLAALELPLNVSNAKTLMAAAARACDEVGLLTTGPDDQAKKVMIVQAQGLPTLSIPYQVLLTATHDAGAKPLK